MKALSSHSTNGFTLIELVVVVVLVAALAVGLTSIITDTTKGYVEAEGRLNMASSARLVIDKLSRDIREAMPNSVRVNAANTCVEFVPILAAATYTDLPITTAGTQVTVVEQDSSSRISSLAPASTYLMIIPLNSSEVYSLSSGHVASITGFSKLGSNLTEVAINATRFTRESPQNRAFFVSQPVSYCLVGDELLRFSNYGFNTAQPSATAMGIGEIVVKPLSTLDRQGALVSIFTYDSGSLNRGGILQVRLIVSARDERVNVEHEIHVRNFP